MLPATMDQTGRFYLGHIGKVPVYAAVDAIFLVIFVFVFVGAGMSMDQILLIFIALLMTILFHELGHALTALAVGQMGVSITITGLGGLCSYVGDRHPKKELAISFAGPATNLMLAWVSWLFLSNGVPTDVTLRFLLEQFWWWNLVLGILNALPIFPLDGGQMALSLGRMVSREYAAKRFALYLSFVTAPLALGAYLVVFPGNLPIFLILMILFLLFTAYRELR